MKILFQGDSITDANRLMTEDGFGNGYPHYVVGMLTEKYKDIDFEFVNRGISGNRCEHLLARWQSDAVDIDPDIISILIGVNDCWFYEDKEAKMPDEYFEYCYRSILDDIKNKTHAKIIMLEPFLIDAPGLPGIRADVSMKTQVVRRLAREYADVYIPCDGIFAEASIHKDPAYWSDDGIHPSPAGAELLARHYVDAISPIIEELYAEK